MRDVVLCADAREALAALADASVDAVVTDPPAGIGFMGKEWDTPGALVERKPERAVTWDRVGGNHHPCSAADRGRTARSEGTKFRAALTPIFAQCVRVLKPGRHALVWALPRTSHWTASALEDAGLYVADVVTHHFGSGFPKSRSLLKPASEHWILCRAPGPLQPLQIDACRVAARGETTSRTVNLRGVLHYAGQNHRPHHDLPEQPRETGGADGGRWPPNTLLSHHPDCRPAGVRRVRGNGHYPAARGAGGLGTSGHAGQRDLAERHMDDEQVQAWSCVADCPIKALDEQAGPRTSGKPGCNAHVRNGGPGEGIYGSGRGLWQDAGPAGQLYGDTGRASRFFPTFAPEPEDAVPFQYVPKASRSERNAGLECLPLRRAGVGADRPSGSFQERLQGHRTPMAQNTHPTVKPIALMQWLVRLVTPPGGLVLDPFCGSGSTLVACVREGMSFIGIDQYEQYCEIARQRVAYEQQRQTGPLFAGVGEG